LGSPSGCLGYKNYLKQPRLPRGLHRGFLDYLVVNKGLFKMLSVATPLWFKCEDETHIPKSGNLESLETLENSKLEFKTPRIEVFFIPLERS
jgi:hypothetical protein